MRFLDIIIKKRDGFKLNEEEIKYFVKNINSKAIPDYQASAFLMAVFFKGMDFEETSILTREMINTGIKADLSFLDVPNADKHSTGGVGDKISIVLAPLVASSGVAVGMMSGRALGHTGGTLDKLESIPSFRVDLTLEEYYSLLKKIHIAMIGQTSEIAVADKYLYALRDATGTVESIPLITSSIMSKKIAEGTSNLVIDLKVGKGAFMKNLKDAKVLAEYMIKVGKSNNVNTKALLTNMDEPLGYHIGNSLEIIECIDILKGDYYAYDVVNLIIELASHMISMAKKVDYSKAKKEAQGLLDSGKALEKFKEMVLAQGGNPKVIEDYSLFGTSEYAKTLYLNDILYNDVNKSENQEIDQNKEIFIESIDAYEIGLASTVAGAGRSRREDKVDPNAGIKLFKKQGDKIKVNDPLLTVFATSEEKFKAALTHIKKAYKFSNEKPEKIKLIYETIE